MVSSQVLQFVAFGAALILQGSLEKDREDLGFVDSTLLLRLLNLVRGGSNASAADLYINSAGLYLLDQSVSIRGRVSSVCTLGYINVEFEHLYLVPNTTSVDLTTRVRLFVYIVLLRKLPRDPTKYALVYPPTVLHHGITEGCVGIAEKLEWYTEPGDRIGAFIPSECSDVENLQGVILSNLTYFTTLCPSQTNLVPVPGFPPHYDTFVTNSSILDVEDISDLEFMMEDYINMSLLLNMNATIVRLPGKCFKFVFIS